MSYFTRIAAPLLAGALLVQPAWAQSTNGPLEDRAPELAALFDAMGMYDILDLLAVENAQGAIEMEGDMFPGRGGQAWAVSAAAINDPNRIADLFEDAVASDALTGAQVDEAMAFYTSDLGQRLVAAEVAARLALTDTEVEERAAQALMDAMTDSEELLEQLERFNALNDLIDRNVSSILTSSVSFYMGLMDGGAFGGDLSEERILAQVWSQESDFRRMTVEWVYTFQLEAYHDFDPADFEDYLAFSGSDTGQTVNSVVFQAFDAVQSRVSYDLGASASTFMASDDI